MLQVSQGFGGSEGKKKFICLLINIIDLIIKKVGIHILLASNGHSLLSLNLLKYCLEYINLFWEGLYRQIGKT